MIRIKVKSFVMRLLVMLSAAVVGIIALSLIFYIVVKGVPNLNITLFLPRYSVKNISMFPAIVNTITVTLLALAAALPLGISTAIFLTEYGGKGKTLVKLIRLTTETLSGIPSIVFGLVGYLVFAVALGLGYSLLGGAMTLAMMILPLIIRTSEEALLGVPDLYREGSFGLGAGRVRTIFRVVLPLAMPYIRSGIMLSVGRIVGETAALLYTAGTAAAIPPNIFGSGRTLSVHMYALLSEGLHMDEAYATAFVLLVLVVVMNIISQKGGET